MLLSFLVLLILDISGGTDHRMRDRADRIPLDESPPVVPNLRSRFCESLEKNCLDSDRMREFRLQCFEPPPPGHVYHCGKTESGELVEFFYKKFPCRKGSYGAPERREAGIVMSCKKCPEDRFNPELRWSPENMDQCRTHYHKTMDEHAVEYLPGNSTASAVSYCNFREGWASANREMFCKHSHHTCKCIPVSCFSLELLPDGSCESWCDGQRLPQNNFSCSKLEQTQTVRPIQTTGSKEPTTETATTRTPPASEEVPVTDKGKLKDIPAAVNGLSHGLIVGIVIGIVIVLLVVVLGVAVFNICRKREPDSITCYVCSRNKETRVSRDYLQFINNKEVHVQNRASACNEEDMTEDENEEENDDMGEN